MSKSIDTQLHEKLLETLTRAVQKKTRPRSATILQSALGHEYRAGSIASDSSLFDITAEHVALLHAIQHNDFKIASVVTLTEEKSVSPLALKILKDYAVRTEHPFSYTVLSPHKDVLFQSDSILDTLPEYTSSAQPLEYLKERTYTNNHFARTDPALTPNKLREYAEHGMEFHFLSEEEGSRYGCAIVTESGAVYTGGAYGSPDKRLGLHAEMVTLATAITGGAQNISHIAVVSNKYTDRPCPICGHCRQFLAELLDKTGGSPKLISLTYGSDDFVEHTLEELLPHKWTSKKW